MNAQLAGEWRRQPGDRRLEHCVWRRREDAQAPHPAGGRDARGSLPARSSVVSRRRSSAVHR